MDVTVSVTPTAYAMGQGLRTFIQETKKAVADGWQPSQDVPTILLAAYKDLVSHIQDIGKLSDEEKIQRPFIQALTLCAQDIALDLLGK